MDIKMTRAVLRYTASKMHNKPELLYTSNALSMVNKHGVNNCSLAINKNGMICPSCEVNGKLPDKSAYDFVMAWQYLHAKVLSLDHPIGDSNVPLKDTI